MMKRRHSGRRRGAGVMSGMRRPLAGDFVKCKHPLPATKGIEFTSLCRSVLVAVRAMSAITLNDTEFSTGELWVFGYGSLMWRPGFEFIERVPARLIGEHRALCVYSFVHRGTSEKPGLVLGLDRGGACRGVAFRVPAKARAETIDYLRAREQVTKVYIETYRTITVFGTPERRVTGLVYCVDRGHAQYAGRLTLDHQLRLVREGHGRSGINRD